MNIKKFFMVLTLCMSMLTGCGNQNTAAAEEDTTIPMAAAQPQKPLTLEKMTKQELYKKIIRISDMDMFESAEDMSQPEEFDLTPENIFLYEKKSKEDGEYLVITGITEDYGEYLKTISEKFARYYKKLSVSIPSEIDGIPVKEIGAKAFLNRNLYALELPDTLEIIGDKAFENTGIQRLYSLPENLQVIGAEAFKNCSLERIEFPNQPLWVKEEAFSGNRDLWTVLAPDVETQLEENVFEGCDKEFLLCYGENSLGKENLVRKYAEENGLESMEIILSKEPFVNYPEEPLVLKPEVRNFFYGDDEFLEEEQWCSWEEDEQAPNFGYSDWQWSGCSSWCAVIDFEQEASASSELTSASNRYAAENVLEQSRYRAWAEGAEGTGIGETIIYRQSCTYPTDNKWEALGHNYREPEKYGNDGFMRYSEICIVNGYAKTEQTWEENGRVKRLLMYVENKPYAYLELEDTIRPQYFLLPEDDIKVLNGGMIEFRFEIEDVYPGSVYEDTCLTGIIMEFTGRHSH